MIYLWGHGPGLGCWCIQMPAPHQVDATFTFTPGSNRLLILLLPLKCSLMPQMVRRITYRCLIAITVFYP